VKSRIRIVLLSVLLSAATVVAVFVVSPTAEAAPPPDVTPVKVAAANLADGHVVYLRGQNAELYWRTVEDFGTPGYSTAWRIIPGGQVGSGPDAAQIDDDSVYLAAKATNSNLLVRRQDGTTFGAWENLGGVITSAPAVLYDSASTRLWVFARGGDGAIWYRLRTGTGPWGAWTSIQGILTSAPDAIFGIGQLTVFARGGNGNLYDRTQNSAGQWGPWSTNGLPVNSATSSLPSGAEFIQFYRNGARHVIRAAHPSPTDIGGIVISAPDTADGDLVAAVGTNRALYVHTNEDGWLLLDGIAA
jgi:hypothetical protein